MSFLHPDVNMVTRPNASDISDYNGNANAAVTSRNYDDSDASARETTDLLDNMPKRKSDKIEIKIVLVKLQAESPLLPTNNKDNTKPAETNNNNSNNNNNNTVPNHISAKAHQHNYTAVDTTANSPIHQSFTETHNHNHSLYNSTNITAASREPLSANKLYLDAVAPSSSPTSSGPSIYGTPASECRRRNSVASLQLFDGNTVTITTTTSTTIDGSGQTEESIIDLDDNADNTDSDNYSESNDNSYSTPTTATLYSNYHYTQTTTHTHQYNSYPQDFFSSIEGERPQHSSKMKTKVDAVGRITGEWGRWQLRTVLLIFLCKIPSSWFMACIIFTAPAPRHGEFFCKPPNTVGAQNDTLWIKVSHPQKEEVDDQEFSIDFCNIYQDAQEHAHHYYRYERPELEPRVWEEPTSRNINIIPCQQFEHRAEYHSVVTQYDLVCSRDILVSVTQFFHLFGVLTGGILANHLLKYFSPRNVMLFGMVSQIFCGNLTGLVASYELHVFFRCLSAVCCAQMYTAGGVIMADITGGVYKTCVSTLFEQFWSIGVILLPGVASFFSSWSHLYMAISWPTVILIYLWRWIPDSPRWMIQRGRVIDAKNILMQCVEVNGTRYGLPHDIDQQLQLQAQTAMDAPPPPGWWSIWKGENVVRNLICVHLAWSLYIVVYYGMLLNIRSFSREHLEVNTAVAGLSEIIGTFIGLFLILKTTRKWLWTGLFNVLAGLIAYLGWLVPTNLPFDARVALLMLSAMISKVAISTTLSILTTCTVELVSEDKRKITAFSAICWARFWLLGAPFIGATVIFGIMVPQTAFASLAIIGGVLTSLITSPRTISKKALGGSNRATATQVDGIDNKGFSTGPTLKNPIFTSITKLAAPNSNLPPQMVPGVWTTKHHEDSPPV
ncbi:organic cation transporter-like protein isoform X1 [Bactrocera oleae]|uniref:organic cation transporter-like protein isoform X1 n=1 Tax=Bactrocera oleae TaxID=104688 RepID=UPI00174EB253|nr:organic cation transporter-like protein isoform X1 [Bactrocera oleae]